MPTVDQLERLLTAEPDDAFLRYALAQAYVAAGRLDDAIAAFAHTIEADPLHAYAWFHRARAEAASDRPADAAASVRAGIDAATRAGDAKALSELHALADELEDV